MKCSASILRAFEFVIYLQEIFQQTLKMASILITGASGFIGSTLIEEALKQGHRVWAGIRATSNKEHLKAQKVHFLELDFAHPNQLRVQLSGHKGTFSKFDVIIHCAGITKTADKREFDRVNYLQTKYFVDTLRELNMVPRQFIYLSSLSVLGAIHEKDGEPFRECDTPEPNTDYGMSKLKAELYIQSIPGFPYTILRPTGVYGPRERDYYLLARSIGRHFDFSAGFNRQSLSFIHVKDLSQAIFLIMEKQIVRQTYILSDGQSYSSRDFSLLIKKELGNPFVIHIKCPLFILKTVSLLFAFESMLSGKARTLNPDKYKIMKQRNWTCDISLAKEELGYTPEYILETGVKETIEWYKDQAWL